jgi:hypothetical protein
MAMSALPSASIPGRPPRAMSCSLRELRSAPAWGSVYVAENRHRVRKVAAFVARPTNLTLRQYGPTGVHLDVDRFPRG